MASAIAAMVIVVLLLVFFVPFMIRRAMKARKSSQSFIPDLIQMSGLQQTGDMFSGTYKGYPATLKFGLDVNYAEAGVNLMSGLAGGGADFHSRSLMSPKFEATFKISGGSLPSLVLKEKVGVLRTDEFLNEFIKGQKVDLPEMKLSDVKLKRIRFFGSDEAMIRKIAASAELQELLSNWHYADIRIGGDEVKLILDDNMVQATYGTRLMTPHYIVQGLDICAAVAKAATA